MSIENQLSKGCRILTMKFTVPQFTEHEPKIVGPLTFKQFAYLGSACAIGFILYHSVPFSVFLISVFILGPIAFAFAFLKVNGRSLSTVLGNFLQFSLSPKTYLWQHKETKIETSEKSALPDKDDEDLEKEKLLLKTTGSLKKLRTQIETQAKSNTTPGGVA